MGFGKHYVQPPLSLLLDLEALEEVNLSILTSLALNL